MSLEQVHLNFSDDSEINKYLSSFYTFHSWLLKDNKLHEEDINAIKEVLIFIVSGTKKKKKRNFKLYFQQFEIEIIKQFIDPLKELISAGIDQNHNLVLLKKNELITIGILNFTKQYIDIISNIDLDEKIDENIKVQSNFKNIEETALLNNKKEKEKYYNQIDTSDTPYREWLKGDIAPILYKLKEAYSTKDVLPNELISNFVKMFTVFSRGKLLIQITKINEKTIFGIPVEITRNGYEEMKHPFLTISWEVSAPIEKYFKNIKFKVGDIIEATFSEQKNDYFKHLLIFVDFVNATVIPRTITSILKSTIKSEVMKDAFNNLNLVEQNDEQIQALVIHKVLETSNLVKEKIDIEIKGLQNQLEELKGKEKELELEKQNLSMKEKEWKTILERIDSCKQVENEKNEKDNEVNLIKYDPSKFIKQLQSLFYYNDEQQLIYKKEIIRSFVYALQSNILTILAGPSGTGKSSIVHAFANAVENVEVRMIPVQSSWTDTQDLLGYFHPTDKAFVPTPFMEALAEARLKENSHKVFLICLDEMNLAHVEYYFSEILSAREGEKQEIRIYPKRHWEMAKIILKEEEVNAERIQSAAELIELYPPVFNIPSNVRFIGTLNMDHTVKPLSPKVIDRSFIIEINHLSVTEKRDIISSLVDIKGKVQMDYNSFNNITSDNEFVKNYIKEIQIISDLFEEFPNAQLNSRGFKHLTKMLSYCQDKSEINQFIDYLIYGKILPRLEIKKNDFEKNENIIIREIEKYNASSEKFQKMLQNKHTITFW